MNSKFFTFIKPVLNYIDSGRFFREPMNWLYTLFAIAYLLMPLIVFGLAVDANVFDMPGKFTISFMLAWLFMAFAGWVGFQIWWDRRLKVLQSSREGDDFTASLSFAHAVQTYGESLGAWIAIVGIGTTLTGALFLDGGQSYQLARFMGSYLGDFAYLFGGSFWAFFLWPVIGYLLVLTFRFFAETIRALGAIANHTRPVSSSTSSLSDDPETVEV